MRPVACFSVALGVKTPEMFAIGEMLKYNAPPPIKIARAAPFSLGNSQIQPYQTNQKYILYIYIYFLFKEYFYVFLIDTALRNHMRIVFEEMSSWTPLTMYLGMKTTFETKKIKSKFVHTFIMRIQNV